MATSAFPFQVQPYYLICHLADTSLRITFTRYIHQIFYTKTYSGPQSPRDRNMMSSNEEDPFLQVQAYISLPPPTTHLGAVTNTTHLVMSSPNSPTPAPSSHLISVSAPSLPQPTLQKSSPPAKNSKPVSQLSLKTSPTSSHQ